MVIEVTTIHIEQRYLDGFQAALPEALSIIGCADGYIGHRVDQSTDDPCRYTLTVRWKDQESAIDRFRESGRMKEVRYVLNRYYDERPRTSYSIESDLGFIGETNASSEPVAC